MKNSNMKNYDRLVYGTIIIGMAMVIISQPISPDASILHISVAPFIANLGAFLTLIGALNLAYEKFSRQQFMNEIREKIVGSTTIADAGIESIYETSIRVNYAPFIESATNMSIMFNFSSRILSDYSTELEKLLNRGGSITIVRLKRDGHVVSLMKEQGYDKDHISSNYKKFDEMILGLGHTDKIVVYDTDVTLKYAAVLFDNDGFLILATSSAGRQSVPAIHFSRGGTLWNFVERDVQAAGK